MKKILILFLTLVVSLFACTEREGSKSSSYSEQVQIEYRDFKTNMEEKLNIMDKKMDRLEEKMDEKSDAAEDAIEAKFEDLKKLRSDIDENLEEMERAAKEKYATLKSTVESKYKQLAEELQKISN